MLFTKDAVQMIGMVLAQKLVKWPEWERNGLPIFLAEIEQRAKNEGFPVVTAANVLTAARKIGYETTEHE